tara:strand:+ start:479 stop:1777 length:1299 start_codon:yes stop_codon:yes gene_type:complete
MNTVILNIYNNYSKNINFRCFLIFLLPICLIVGSAFVNFILTLIFFIFFFDIIKKKDFKIFQISWIKLFLAFWFYTLILSFFATDVIISLKNSFSQIRFLTLVLFIYKNLEMKSYLIFIFISLLSIIFVSIDNNIQFFTGLDIFGFPAEGYVYDVRTFNLRESTVYDIGRLSGPFKDELIPGAYLLKMSIIGLCYIFSVFKNLNKFKQILFFLLTLFLIESIIITGERTSSIIFVLFLFILFIRITSFKKVFFVSILITFFISISILNSGFLKMRVNDTVKIVSDYNNSSYGRLASSAFALSKENIMFGSGLKNYRIDCQKLIDPIPSHEFSYCSPTHPHNTLLELLSETGIVGTILYISFLIIFFTETSKRLNKNLHKKNKLNYFGLITFIILSLLPILPSGSLFTTWNGTFFWLVISVAFFLSKEKKIKF